MNNRIPRTSRKRKLPPKPVCNPRSSKKLKKGKPHTPSERLPKLEPTFINALKGVLNASCLTPQDIEILRIDCQNKALKSSIDDHFSPLSRCLSTALESSKEAFQKSQENILNMLKAALTVNHGVLLRPDIIKLFQLIQNPDESDFTKKVISILSNNNTPEGRQYITELIADSCKTPKSRELMATEPIKDLLCSFKGKENTPEGRQQIACAIARMCGTENGRALMATDESIRDFFAPLKIKRLRHWGVGK